MNHLAKGEQITVLERITIILYSKIVDKPFFRIIPNVTQIDTNGSTPKPFASIPFYTDILVYLLEKIYAVYGLAMIPHSHTGTHLSNHINNIEVLLSCRAVSAGMSQM